MSEHQCYEFVALDRPLTAKEMAALRAISTRAEISPTRFWNEYQWGDLKADPAKLVERYFDAHLYYANWGTHRLMLRMPRARVEVKALKACFVGRHRAGLKVVGDHVVLDLGSDTEEPEDDDGSQVSLAVLSPLRAELMRGDLRPAYLAWLLAVQAGDVKDDATEPPVPEGLGSLTGAQQAMVEFLRIDVDLVAAAAAVSAAATEGDDAFRRWVTRLSGAQQESWLLRAIEAPDLALGTELLRTFRAQQRPVVAGSRRAAGDLLTAAEALRSARAQAKAARERKARQAAEHAHQRRLDQLGRDVDRAWLKLEQLVATSAYDPAVALAADLKDLATREGELPSFAGRFEAMRRRQSRRRGFFDRWKYQDPVRAR